MSARALALVIVLAGLGHGAPAAAHDLRPGVLAFVEVAPGELRLRFVPPVDNRGETAELGLVLPAGCARSGDRVRCAGPFAGELAVTGMRGHAMKIAVTVTRTDGARHEWILTSAEPRCVISRAPPSTAPAWIGIGVAHILGGPDHLAFVLGLLLVLGLAVDRGSRRRLLLTISAFTVAHSSTLALAVLDVVRVPTAPVEACIALSVVLVAREAMHREPTAIRRWPWLAAGVFGLVHGLGFAAALGDIGLPAASLAWSLAWFNVGVELGQLAVVVLVVGLAALVRRLIGERRIVGPWIHGAACYALGALAGWWLIDRVLALACR